MNHPTEHEERLFPPDDPPVIDKPKNRKRPRRRWYQFSLRTMLIVTTLVAAVMGLLGRSMSDHRREVAVLESFGTAEIWFAWEYVPVFGSNVCWRVVGATIYQRVRRLYFYSPLPADFDPTQLADLRHLRELSFVDLPLDDDQLAVVGELHELEILDLSGTNATDVALTHLEGLKKLRSIRTGGTKVTYVALQRLQSKLPNAIDLCQLRAGDEIELAACDTYTYPNAPASHDAINPAGDRDVHAVTFFHQRQVADLEHLAYLPRLRKLELYGHTTEEMLRLLGYLDTLESLTIHSRLGDEGEGPRHLAGLNRLKVLRLKRFSFEEVELRFLAEMEDLEELSLSGTGISGSELKHLRQLPRLRRLIIGTASDETHTGAHDIDDVDLPTLAELKTLEELELAGTRISDAGEAWLKGALPNTRIWIRTWVPGVTPP